MKEIFLHIGPHKTGSTFIQEVLYDQTDLLKAHSVSYVTHKKHIAHNHISNSLLKGKLDLVEEEINTLLDCEEAKVVISAEGFEDLGEKEINILKSLLKPDNKINIIFFKRNIGDLLVSSWQESVKHGSYLSWSHFFTNHVLFPYKSKILNQSLVIDRYVKEFGQNKIKIFDYDTLISNKVNIAKTFIEFIIGEEFALDDNRLINKSNKYSDIEIIRMLNSFFYNDFQFTPKQFLRNEYLSLKKESKEVQNIIEKIYKHIDTTYCQVNLTNSIVLQNLEKHFQTKNMDLYLNSPSVGTKGTTLNLPGDNWYGSKNIVHLLEEIYMLLLKKERLATYIEKNKKKHAKKIANR